MTVIQVNLFLMSLLVYALDLVCSDKFLISFLSFLTIFSAIIYLRKYIYDCLE